MFRVNSGPSTKTKVEKECKDLVVGEKQNQTTSGDVFLETSNIPLLSWGCSWAVFVPCCFTSSTSSQTQPFCGVSVDSGEEALLTTQLNPAQAAWSGYSSGQWLLCHLQPPYFTRWCDCVSELCGSALAKPLPRDQRLFTRATTAS